MLSYRALKKILIMTPSRITQRKVETTIKNKMDLHNF